MSVITADRLVNDKKLKCQGCESDNFLGSESETSAPFYEVEVWNYSMTDKEGKEIYCSECLSNILTEDPLSIHSTKQIWISDYDLKSRRDWRE